MYLESCSHYVTVQLYTMGGRQLIERFLLLLFVLECVKGVTIKQLGSFKVDNPAFVTLYEKQNVSSPAEKYDFVVSCFSAVPFATDSVQTVVNIGKYTAAIDDVIPTVVTTKTTWPNEVAGIPEEIFGRKAILIPDGFILPFKGDGSLSVMDVSGSIPLGPYKITDDSTGQWFYHRVEWRDMDGDGDLDAVNCRAREPIFGSKASELVWFENPGGTFTSPWQAHVLSDGPDIFFQYTILNTTSGPLHAIVTAQFFTKSLSVYWTLDPGGKWTDKSQIKSRVIDATLGAVFEVKLEDMNGDGKVDLLVTSNGNNGTVNIYEIPEDFRTGTFTRHVISSGYSPQKQQTGRGAPGSPFAVFTKSKKKPFIALSGDDDGNAYILSPASDEPTDWSYDRSTILTAGGTVGQLALADVDGDGRMEMFVPSYTTSIVYVYRLDD